MNHVIRSNIYIFFFLGGNGLAFCGSSHRIGDPSNGDFLGLIELLSRWDTILQVHVQNAKEYWGKCERLRVHYLSPESQDKFISTFSSTVKQHIMLERRIFRYFAVIVDASSDSSHVEQTTILVSYSNLRDDGYDVNKRFLMLLIAVVSGRKRLLN